VVRRLLVVAIAALAAAAAVPRPAGPRPELPPALPAALQASHREGRTWALIEHLTGRIGPRLSGSAGAEQAVAWAEAELRAAGLAVRREPVKVPVWTRGLEKAELLSPEKAPLRVIALGGTDPTPAEGVSGEVTVVSSLEEVEALPADALKGRIALYHVERPTPTTSEEATAFYSAISRLRTRGAVVAARKGAIAALVRSAGTSDDPTRLHTGAMRYVDGSPRIPAAAIAVGDARRLASLARAGTPPRVHLTLLASSGPDADSANVVAEVRGRERPDEVVVIGAHLDSWDVGTGAHDDGAGVVAVMEAARVLQSLPVKPRRTVRAVLFMNEENGLRGGRAYRATHQAAMERHVAAVESDSGGGPPRAISAWVGPQGLDHLRALLPLLAGTGVDVVEPSDSGGADISPMKQDGVPLLGLRQDSTDYFDFHHSAADVLANLDRKHLERQVDAMARLAWALAEMEPGLPRPPPTVEAPSTF
jgi:carboxypeptidase Q